MASESILKSFVISLGFKTDETQFRRFQESMGATSKGALELTKNFIAAGAAVAGAAVATVVGLDKVAGSYKSLYFAAQNTGASGNELKAFTVGFEKIGISAEQAQQSIEAFSAARRSMPGIDQMLGIDPGQTDNAKAFIKVLSDLANQDHGGAYTHAIAAQKAAMVGISEEMLTRFEKNPALFIKGLQDTAKIVDKFNVGGMAKDSLVYDNKFLDTKTRIDLTADKVATDQMPAAEKILATTDKLVDLYNQLDDKSGGWLGHLTAISTVSTGILTTWKLIAGLRGATAVASIAEAGGAAAGGGILATAAGLVAPITAAVIGSHYLDKWTKGTFWGSDQESAPGQGGVSLSQQWSGFTKPLADFTASFEGHARNGYATYKDIAGHLTAGFGHLVRPGEDLSTLDKQGAISLLAKDLQAAGASVKQLVHVALSSNQMKALTDLDFNIGDGNFKSSTLLKELNAGHYEAAAAQFSQWNKVLQNGHYVANEGLARRRAAEEQLFRTPDRPNVTVSQKTDIHIEAGPDAQATADKVARAQNRTNGDLVRNFAGAVS